MTGWHQKRMVAFDTETTGLDVEEDRIVSACVAVITPQDPPPWKIDTRQHLIDPGVDIPEEATKVHGITNAWIKEHGVPPPEALDLIAADLALSCVAGVPVVGMNLAYDLTMLDRECRRHAIPTLAERLDGRVSPIIDVLVLDKQVEPRRKGSRNLKALCDHYGVTLTGAHDSTVDALAAARVAWRIAEKYPWLAGMPVGVLHASQVKWRMEQQESFAVWLRKQGRDASDVDGHWPVRPLPEPEEVTTDE